MADLAVTGLGYVGLPLALEAVRAGLDVVGFDVSSAVVDGLNEGRSHVDDVSDADVSTMLNAGFRATTEGSELGQADTVVICVPTPLSEEGGPDLGLVRAAAHVLAHHLRRGMLVVLESTTYPGTTDEVLAPILEESGLKRGWISTSHSRPSALTRAMRRSECVTRRKWLAGTRPLARKGRRHSMASLWKRW